MKKLIEKQDKETEAFIKYLNKNYFGGLVPSKVEEEIQNFVARIRLDVAQHFKKKIEIYLKNKE